MRMRDVSLVRCSAHGVSRTQTHQGEAVKVATWECVDHKAGDQRKQSREMESPDGSSDHLQNKSSGKSLASGIVGMAPCPRAECIRRRCSFAVLTYIHLRAAKIARWQDESKSNSSKSSRQLVVACHRSAHLIRHRDATLRRSVRGSQLSRVRLQALPDIPRRHSSFFSSTAASAISGRSGQTTRSCDARGYSWSFHPVPSPCAAPPHQHQHASLQLLQSSADSPTL